MNQRSGKTTEILWSDSPKDSLKQIFEFYNLNVSKHIADKIILINSITSLSSCSNVIVTL
jgi:hypothetical protein